MYSSLLQYLFLILCTCFFTFSEIIMMSVTGAPTHTARNSMVYPSYINYLKGEFHGAFSAMFTHLNNSTNQQLFEKNLCNQSSHYEITVMSARVPVLLLLI